jgi:uncharacterized protein (DUF2336 family)
MSEVVPSGGETGGAAQLLASARERLSVALADLALPDRLRLTEWQRTIIAALLAGLVRSVEDELRSALAFQFRGAGEEALHAALSSAHVRLAEPVLERSAVLSDPALISTLIRRAEEHRLHKASTGENALLLELVGDEQEDIAGDAMALLIAQSGRLDGFQEPLMVRAELSAELAHNLVWTVAAALRRYIVGQHRVNPAAADPPIAAAAGQLLAGYDEGQTFDSLCLRLVRRLQSHDRLDDEIVARTLAEGSLPLFLAALAVRAGLDAGSVWEVLSAPGGRGPPLLLRAAGIARSAAGAILFRLSGDEEAVGPQLDLFDILADEEARRLLGLWRVDPGYRAAIARLAS